MKAWAVSMGLCALLGLLVGPLRAQDGEAVYQTWCAICHDAGGESGASGRDVMAQMTPEQILASLERGTMSSQGRERSRAERRALAEFLSGKSFGDAPVNPIPSAAFCSDARLSTAPSAALWNGWGADLGNTRFQPEAAAGLVADNVSRLKLGWAFGFPGASSAGLQPVVWDGRVYVGSWEGDVYSLDAETGCLHWMLETESGVPAAVIMGKTDDGALTAYFGDLAANVYAVSAASGKLLWKVKVDDYPLARVRGSPILHEGRLYVPVSSREESRVRDPRYPCCRFRGSMVALNATTGRQIWKTYTIPEPPRPTQKSRNGTQLWGPSGVAIWVAPSLDPERRTLYVGTGNDYSAPATSASDAIVAFDMDSGAIRWIRQMTENDIWNSSCRQVDRDPAKCPDPDAPDFDFAASPILVKLEDGQQMLIAPQKSGLVYALDLDRQGEILWYRRVGKGGTQGGIMFGPAADNENLYVAISDFERMPGTRDANPKVGGGLVALALKDGNQLWRTPAPPCGDRTPCSPAQGAAITAIPGVVFSGSVDGHLRAYSTGDGKILWDYDTVRDFTTVNGVNARGGSFYSGGPAVVDGMLFASPGYAHHGGIIPGNVLLAFSVEEE